MRRSTLPLSRHCQARHNASTSGELALPRSSICRIPSGNRPHEPHSCGCTLPYCGEEVTQQIQQLRPQLLGHNPSCFGALLRLQRFADGLHGLDTLLLHVVSALKLLPSVTDLLLAFTKHAFEIPGLLIHRHCNLYTHGPLQHSSDNTGLESFCMDFAKHKAFSCHTLFEGRAFWRQPFLT